MQDSAISSLAVGTSGLPAPPTRRILIIEDDPDVAESLRQFVESHRATIVAASLAEARTQFQYHDVAAVILDENLPDGSGLSWLEEVRAEGWSGPALMLTGRFEREVANRAHTLNSQCVFKPADPENIGLFVEQVLRRESMPKDRIEQALQAFVAQHGVTPRETDALRAACEEVPRGELHVALGVSENTAKSLIRALLKRVRAKNLDEVKERVLRLVVDDAGAR